MALARSLASSSTGFRDGLGERSLQFDRERALTLEALHLRPEFGAFGSALSEQLTALESFRHRSFTHLRGLAGTPGRLILLSDHIPGTRLSDVLRAASSRQVIVDADTALYLTKRLLTAMAAYVAANGYTHGALVPDRIIVTRRGRVVIAEHLLVPALLRLRLSRARWWREFRIAMPLSRLEAVFDERTDVAQIGAVALGLLQGRPLEDDEGPV